MSDNIKRIPKYAEIKINNMVIGGKFHFKKRLSFDEIEKLIEKSHFGWGIMNQDTTPQLYTYIVREDTSKIYVGLWHTGSFIMSGLKSESEVDIYFREILKELKKIVPCAFKKNGGKGNGH